MNKNYLDWKNWVIREKWFQGDEFGPKIKAINILRLNWKKNQEDNWARI